jgi:hypothetical protein
VENSKLPHVTQGKSLRQSAATHLLYFVRCQLHATKLSKISGPEASERAGAGGLRPCALSETPLPRAGSLKINERQTLSTGFGRREFSETAKKFPSDFSGGKGEFIPSNFARQSRVRRFLRPNKRGESTATSDVLNHTGRGICGKGGRAKSGESRAECQIGERSADRNPIVGQQPAPNRRRNDVSTRGPKAAHRARGRQSALRIRGWGREGFSALMPKPEPARFDLASLVRRERAVRRFSAHHAAPVLARMRSIPRRSRETDSIRISRRRPIWREILAAEAPGKSGDEENFSLAIRNSLFASFSLLATRYSLLAIPYSLLRRGTTPLGRSGGGGQG